MTVEFKEPTGDVASAKMMMDLMSASASDEVKARLNKA